MDASRLLGGCIAAAEFAANETREFGIEAVTAETFEDGDQKLVLALNNGQKFPLNKTNARTMITSFGRETDLWVGKTIAVRCTTTRFRGSEVPCLRIADSADF